MTTVFTVQHHSTIGTRQNEYHEALPSSANDEMRCDCTFTDGGNASWYSVCRVPMVEWRLDCENCRHLTVVGLHDTGPRSAGDADSLRLSHWGMHTRIELQWTKWAYIEPTHNHTRNFFSTPTPLVFSMLLYEIHSSSRTSPTASSPAKLLMLLRPSDKICRHDCRDRLCTQVTAVVCLSICLFVLSVG